MRSSISLGVFNKERYDYTQQHQQQQQKQWQQQQY